MKKSMMMFNIILDLTEFGSPPSTLEQVLNTIMAMKASSTSPTLKQNTSSVNFEMPNGECGVDNGDRGMYSRRNQTDDAAPTKFNTATGEQRLIESVGSTLDLCQDLSVLLGDSWRQCLSAFLDFASRGAIKPGGRDGFKVGVL